MRAKLRARRQGYYAGNARHRVQDLFEDIEEAFINSYRVPAAGGHWLSSHPHEELSGSWGSFVRAVKHETRYFFTNLKSEEPGEYSPAGLLEKISALVDELALISHLREGKPVNLGPPLDSTNAAAAIVTDTDGESLQT